MDNFTRFMNRSTELQKNIGVTKEEFISYYIKNHNIISTSPDVYIHKNEAGNHLLKMRLYDICVEIKHMGSWAGRHYIYICTAI